MTSYLSYLNPIPSLPEYQGPHKVGSTEFEIPVSEIVSSSTVPNSKITTIKFRLFYPCQKDYVPKESLWWLPTPQSRWTEAYASFMGASERTSSIVSSLPSLLNYAKIPALKDAPVQEAEAKEGLPVCIFSHGLGGNYNTYSSIVGSIASCGIFCVTPEHRDGSAPTSLIRNEKKEIVETIPYQKHSHAISKEVLDARNEQLRVRLWELELIYTAIKDINNGKSFSNYADQNTFESSTLKDALNLRPSRVTWAGHSFGAATITQFVKSVYYHEHLPKPSSSDSSDPSTRPLYQTTIDSDLVKQITPHSPIALLDLWTMPLRSDTTRWLWERPLPCYDQSQSVTSLSSDLTRLSCSPNTVAIMSAEFYKWTDLLNRTRALLSARPAQAIQKLEQEMKGTKTQEEAERPGRATRPGLRRRDTSPTLKIPELQKGEAPTTTPPQSQDNSRTSSPAPPAADANSADTSHNVSPSSSTSSLPATDSSSTSISNPTTSAQPHLYHIANTAHLSQSDFGPLFPRLIKYMMKALDPEKTIELNVRAILAVMHSSGLNVDDLVADSKSTKNSTDEQGEKEQVEDLLRGEERMKRIPLVET